MATGVILLAAGTGQRFGGARPKQYLPLNGQPLYRRSLRVFQSLATVSEIVVVVPPRDVSSFQRMSFKKGRASLVVAAGGAYRGASVRNGFLSFQNKHDVVLVHDSARPLIDAALVRRVESASRKAGAALAAWPLPDTLKEEKGGHVRRTIPRKNLWLAQTPQGFRWDVARACLTKPRPEATDDVDLAQRKGFRVKIVEGSPYNFKITYKDDFKLAQQVLSLRGAK